MGLTEDPGVSPLCSGLGKWPFREEVLRLVTGKVCTPEVRARCRRENGEFADWACGECTEFLQPESISPWTWHLLMLFRLKKAGYPFRANDLSLETWLLLGEMEAALIKGGRC